MNDDLRNPMSLFDISSKVAIVTGASGAFGAYASKVLAAAGARLVIAAGNKAELDVAVLTFSSWRRARTMSRKSST